MTEGHVEQRRTRVCTRVILNPDNDLVIEWD